MDVEFGYWTDKKLTKTAILIKDVTLLQKFYDKTHLDADKIYIFASLNHDDLKKEYESVR